VHFSAIVAVLRNPIRLAEDLAVLDLISGGRVEMTLGIGYRLHSTPCSGSTRSGGQRPPVGHRTDEQAWSGEPFEYEGVTVRSSSAGAAASPLSIGGSTESGGRAGLRYGDDFVPATPLYDRYLEELDRLGKRGGAGRGPLFLFVSDDLTGTGPSSRPVIYNSNSNAEWAKGAALGDLRLFRRE
jgi:alkanesulfonate monooxygenase SsuD/methylene tetrahydromethanopterin reductase-like flavin-dependent oxidoreductase (luciferase family)